ncbi:PIN domain-containing protein [Gordonia jacobaea]|uniref:PIN domain-containing protein n=1 Tax=Gordonia jacobaea TaxID=122202 RepID=UPI003D75AC47
MNVDTSALLALVDASQSQHEAVSAVIDASDEPFVISPFIVVELDYVVLTRHDSRIERIMLDELASGASELAPASREQLSAASTLVRQYSDAPVGVADASNIVLADSTRTVPLSIVDTSASCPWVTVRRR